MFGCVYVIANVLNVWIVGLIQPLCQLDDTYDELRQMAG